MYAVNKGLRIYKDTNAKRNYIQLSIGIEKFMQDRVGTLKNLSQTEIYQYDFNHGDRNSNLIFHFRYTLIVLLFSKCTRRYTFGQTRIRFICKIPRIQEVNISKTDFLCDVIMEKLPFAPREIESVHRGRTI